MFCCLMFAMPLCASFYICLVVTCWERADLMALVCGVCCEFVTFPLVSWVRCGTWLYRFLIFAPLLTSIGKSLPNSRIKPRMHVRRSIKYEKLHFFARTGVMKTSTVACGFTPIKIHYSDYPKRINEVYVWRYLSFIYSNVYCGMV